jgi:hypothetical protein
MTAQKQLVTVKTGEPYQPIRIYYWVLKKKTLLSALQKLRCVEYDADRDRWNWLYEAEAKKLRFDRSYSALTAADRPLILGYFTFRGEDQMLLDLRSIERALHALEFFDKRISRYAAMPTRLRIVNRYFSADEMPNAEIHPSLDPFFERDNIPCLAQQTEEALNRIAQEYADDPEARDKAFSDYTSQQMKRPHPEIEELPIHSDKEDRIGLSMALRIRQMEAFEHWRGNFTFTSADVLQQFTEVISKNFDEDELEAAELDQPSDEQHKAASG